MTDKTVINLMMDKDIKKRFDSVCQELGMSSSTAFHLLINKMIRENRIPFVISDNPNCLESDISFLEYVDNDGEPYLIEHVINEFE